MTKEAKFTYEEASKLFSYDPADGKIRLLVKSRKFPIGVEAGVINSNGYRIVHMFGRREYAHRLAWLLSKERLPRDGHIDHINRIRDDNRIANLRHAEHAANLHNSSLNKNNTTGYRGIFRNKKRWSAHITIDRKVLHLGTADTPEEAAHLYDAAVMKYRDEYAGLNFPRRHIEVGDIQEPAPAP